MPCYRCGARQADPEPGKSSPWRRGVIREHQVLICPGCQTAALADLSRCPGCGGAHLIRRLDQVECLDCRLTRDAGTADDGEAAASGDAAGGDAVGGDAPSGGSDGGGAPGRGADGGGLAAEVARALDKLRARP